MADSITSFGGVIKLQGEKEYQKAINYCTQALKALSEDLKLNTLLYETQGKSLEQAERVTDSYTATLKEQGEKLDILRSQRDRLNEEVETTRKYIEQETQALEQENQKLSDIEKTLGSTSSEYKTQEEVVKALQKELTSSESSYKTLSTNLEKTYTALNKTAYESEKTKIAYSDFAREVESSQSAFSKGETSLSSFNKELESTQKIAKDTSTEKSFSSKANAFSKVGKSLAVAVTGVSTAIIAGTTKLANYGNEVQRTAEKLSLSNKGFQELNYAFKVTDGDINNLQVGMKIIQQTLDGVKSGTLEEAEAQDRLSTSLRNADGSFKSAEQVLYDGISAMADMADESQQAAAAYKMFGRNYREVLPLMAKGSKGFKELTSQASEYGAVLSDEVITNSTTLANTIDKMQESFKGFINNALSEALPSLTQITEGLAQMSAGIAGWEDVLSAGIRDFMSALKTELNKLKPIITAVLKELASMLPDIVSGLMDLLTYALGEVIEALPDLVVTLITKVPDLVDRIVVGTLDAIKKLPQALAKGLKDFFVGAPVEKTPLEEQLDSINEEIKKRGFALIQTADGVTRQVYKAYIKDNQLLIDGVVEKTESYTEVVRQASQVMVEGTKNSAITPDFLSFISFFDTLIAYLEEGSEESIKKAEKLMDDNRNTWTGMVGKMYKALEAILDSPQSYLEEGKFLPNLYDVLIQAGFAKDSDAWKMMDEATAGVTQHLTTRYDDFPVEKTRTKLESFAGVLYASADEIRDASEELNGSLEEVVEETKDSEEEIAKGIEGYSLIDFLLESIVSARSMEELKKAKEELHNLLEDFIPMESTAYEKGKQSFSNVIAYYEGRLEILMRQVVNSDWAKIVRNIGEPIYDLAKSIVDSCLFLVKNGIKAVQEVSQGFGEVVNQVADYATALADTDMASFNIFEKLFSVDQDALDVFLNQLPEIIAGLEERMPEIVKEVQSLVILLMEELVPVIVDAVPILMEGLGEIIETLFLELGYIIREKLPELIEAIGNGLLELLPQIVESTVQLAIQTIEGLISNLPRLLVKIFQLIIKIISSVFVSIWDLITGKAKKKLEEQQKEAEKQAEELAKKASSNAQATVSSNTTDWAAYNLQQKKNYDRYVNGLKEALSNMIITLDGKKVGKYVVATVSQQVYNRNQIVQDIKRW